MADPPSAQQLSCTTINDFPEEILLEIVKNTKDSYSWDRKAVRKNYYNLCLVKPFRRVATEFLYYRIDHLGVGLVKLLHTVLLHPELAALIRVLDLGWETASDISPTKGDLDLVAEHIEKLALTAENEKSWILHLEDDWACATVYTAVLLLHAPNITVLGAPYDRDNFPVFLDEPCFYWAAAFHRNFYAAPQPPIPKYHQLKSISIIENSIYVEDIIPIFQLQSLQYLRVSALVELRTENAWAWPSSAFGKGMSNIKVLKLDDCGIEPEAQGLMVSACRALEEFCYEPSHYLTGKYRPASGVIDLNPISRALQASKLSLRKLIFHHTMISAFYDNCTMIAHHFRDFPRLETIHLDAALIFTAESPFPKLSCILPSGIKQLCIRHTWYDLFENLMSFDGPLSDMVGTAGTVFPSLMQLSIGTGGCFPAPGYDHRLEKEFSHRGIWAYSFWDGSGIR
ncbi:hypothetical protein BU26DRAFT_564035 [Trematosphaeria pertusa]|uniref:F-box domain-containing protein n=1 Tax=Trematosphaeria pertusa TaxID=390896 RepID=A0A6A6IIW1_9PLEO|nr:uncharacterized protein BU26DRAFT_564035 [Trematosphaeria pertusa]KAF2250159.1 hypothetical protein BU26DRAFT_564035 [Trematosphaeria pertusa]